MNYLAAYTDFFKQANWTKLLLMPALCCLIPFVGVIVVLGWLLANFWGRYTQNPVVLTPFSFDDFGVNLKRGLWPALVGVAAGVVSMVLVMLPTFIMGLGGGKGLFMIVGLLLLAVAVLALLVASAFVFKPMAFRASVLQDFSAAFDFDFVKKFAMTVKVEIIISVLVLMGGSLVLSVISGVIPCLGFLVAVALFPVVLFAGVHLDRQLYLLYLQRGGAELPISPLLTDEPKPQIPQDAPLQ